MATAEIFDEGRGFRVRRLAVLVLGAAALAGIGAGVYFWRFAGDGGGSSAARPETTTVTRGQLVNSFTTTGTANATLSSKLNFSSSGRVKSINVAVGDRVTAGQELARLDDRDAQRKLDSARANLSVAQIKLQQMQEPPSQADVAAANQAVVSAQQQEASAQQSIVSAQAQVATAQDNLDKATRPPAAADVAAADAAVTQSQASLQNAKNAVDTAWSTLVNAQRNYCSQQSHLLNICYAASVPLSSQSVIDLNGQLKLASGSSPDITALVSAVNGLLQANTSYQNAQNAVAPAQQNVASAQTKRQALDDPPNASDLAVLQAAVNTARGSLATAQSGLGSARAAVTSAQAKLADLLAGPRETDLALQKQSVQLAQISLQQAQDALDDLVLKAPVDGEVGSVTVNVGDQSGGSTAAMTLSNPAGMRVDLTVSESDVSSLKAGQFGAATFDALPGRTYLVKIVGVSTIATVTQGVVTYPVQAQILNAQGLTDNAAQLTPLLSGLQSLLGSARANAFSAGGGSTGGAAPGGPSRAPGTAAAAGQSGQAPRFQATPNASRTPNPSRTPNAGGSGTNGTTFLQALANQPLPSPGMTANVVVLLDVKEDALLVPTSAVRRQGRTTYVNVVKADGSYEQRDVITGGTNATQTVITEGLQEADRILASAPPTGSVSSATPFARQPTPAGGVR
ncbi:MAG: HlyD family efflux transporter periplasmic adaptor subunit [Dehalococcoidia bacterium]|nr:HlyD family efflux transporter periplasmic adaptor subunit [Dehalococcoidia bacterium]